MIILTQASDGGTGIFLAVFIAIGLFALAAWGTHWIWYFRSFGMFARGNVVLNARYFLGVIGLVVPIVGIIHGVAIWVGKGVRVVDDPRTTFDDLPIEQQASDLRRRMLLFGAAIIVCTGMTAYELVQVEYDGAERTVWAPLAGLYNALAFWPAVLFFPALGLFEWLDLTAAAGYGRPIDKGDRILTRGAGWAGGTVVFEGRRIELDASYIHDTFKDIVEALLSACRGQEAVEWSIFMNPRRPTST